MTSTEEQLAQLVAPYAARENAACAQHWDHARWNDARPQAHAIQKAKGGNIGRHGERQKRLDTFVAYLRTNGPARCRDIARMLGVAEKTVTDYARELQTVGLIRVEVIRDGRRGVFEGSVYHPVEAEA